MFEKLIENRLRLVHFIGAKVVDDTEDFNIPVSLPPPPPPEEGRATIVDVITPSSFTPNVSFTMTTKVRNDGGDDKLFVKITNKDTGAVLKDYTLPTPIPSGITWTFDWIITITQTTDFHGRVEAGHEE